MRGAAGSGHRPWGRAAGRPPLLLAGAARPSFAGGEGMPDPISRLQIVQQEIDRVFGAGYERCCKTAIIAD
jgi:hypothetical protein